MVIFQPDSPREGAFVTFPSPVIFNLDMLRRVALSLRENSGISICSDRKLCDLEYLNDVVPVSDDPSKLHIFPGRLNDSVVVLEK